MKLKHKLMLALVPALFSGAAASADAYPSRAVRVVVPYPPGGGTDVLTRLVGKHLNESLKQSFVVDNRPGATGAIGVELVSKSPPDGYTLMAVAAGPLDDEKLKLFQPIALFAAPSYILVVHPSVPVKGVKELVTLAKSPASKLSYGSTGTGSASHLSSELFNAMAGTNVMHVPYKGTGQAVTDLLGGHVQMMIAPPQAVMTHVKSGKLKALGMTGAKRAATLQDLAPIAESVPGYESNGWFGLVAPAATPRPIIDQLNREVNRILATPAMKERLAELGADPARTTPEEFLAFIKRDNDKWEKLIKQRNIEIERH